MLAFLLLIANAFGDAGFDEPAYVQVVKFSVTYGVATESDVDGAAAAILTAVAGAISTSDYTVAAGDITQDSHDTPNLSFSVKYQSEDDADAAVSGLTADPTTFCGALQTDIQANAIATWESDATCASSAHVPLSFDVTYAGVDGTAVGTEASALASAVAGALSLQAAQIVVTGIDAADLDFNVYVNSLQTVASSEAMVNSLGDTFCSDLQTAFVATLTDFTSAAGCVSNKASALQKYAASLNSNCESGEYEVSGINTGTAVLLNFDNSDISVDSTDMKSYLSLEFEVPTMYFFNDQTVGSLTYDRSVAVTFHNRQCHDSYTFLQNTDNTATAKQCSDVTGDLTTTCGDLNTQIAAYGTADVSVQCPVSCSSCGSWVPDTSACYTSKTSYAECPSVEMQWTHEDSSDSCSQRLTAKLLFEDLLYGNSGRNDGIIIKDDQRTINGVLFDTWEVYMVAYVETWAGYVQTSDLAGNQNLDFNNPDTAVSDWTDHLSINQERYSYYSLPFIVAFPKTITIEATQPVTSYAQLIVLYAVVEQEMLTINFTPDTANGGNFGSATLKVRTQVQFPYGLRKSDDATAPAQVGIDTDEHTRLSQTVTAASIVFTTEQDSTHCDGTVAHGEYCLQEWDLTITPNLCDISGQYYLKFWAVCFDTSADAQCALDINSGNGAGVGNEVDCKANPTNTACTNSYSGKLQFSLSAQEFCPEILDTVRTEGTIAIYEDPDFTVTAQPGVNLFVNDHVYVETTFLTKSDKSGLDYAAGDDTLIEFVRPYKITMMVEMQDVPLQTTVNVANSDVTYADPSDPLIYTLVLCEVSPLVFPYTDVTLNTDCFQSMKWNAINRLAFTKQTTAGANTADDNEILFSLRLDERVIPVDLPNNPATITISEDVEIYYIGNTNPVRRRLDREVPRRRLEQTQRQTQRVSTSFELGPNNNLAFCTLREHLMFTGFELEVITDLLDIPETQSDSVAHMNDLKYSLATYLGLDPTTDIEIYKMDHCSAGECFELFPRRNLRDIQYMRYYIDVKNSDAANRFQTELMARTSGIYTDNNWLEGKVLQGMRVDHCNPGVADLFNGYRTTDAQNNLFDSTPSQEESSSWAFGVLVVAHLMALFHL